MQKIISTVAKAIASTLLIALSALGVLVQSAIQSLINHSFKFAEFLGEEITASALLVFASSKTVFLCFVYFWIGFFGLHKNAN